MYEFVYDVGGIAVLLKEVSEEFEFDIEVNP